MISDNTLNCALGTKDCSLPEVWDGLDNDEETTNPITIDDTMLQLLRFIVMFLLLL